MRRLLQAPVGLNGKANRRLGEATWDLSRAASPGRRGSFPRRYRWDDGLRVVFSMGKAIRSCGCAGRSSGGGPDRRASVILLYQPKSKAVHLRMDLRCLGEAVEVGVGPNLQDRGRSKLIRRGGRANRATGEADPIRRCREPFRGSPF